MTTTKQAAHELGIDVASIKAVIEIEAGQTHQGFYKPNQPIINFDLTMFKKWVARHGNKARQILKKQRRCLRPSQRQKVRLLPGRAIRAPEVGAFNRFHRGNRGNILGHVPDRRIQLEEMRHRIARGLPARRMSTSEKEQLELFVNFLKSNNLVKYLKAKNWAGFALRYNGPPTPSAAITPALQKAYSKYKKQSKK